jgi:hypothetical protein
MKPCTPNYRACVYLSFLLLPIITLVLLQIFPWHEKNSECDPHTGSWGLVATSTNSDTDAVPMRGYVWHYGKCTCMVEFLLYMRILATFEFLVFVYLWASDPIKHTPSVTILAAFECLCSLRLAGIVVFDISYLTLIGLAFSAQIQSNKWCGILLYMGGIVSFIVRLILLLIYNLMLRIPRRDRVLSIQFSNLYTAVHTQQVIPL